MIRRQKRRVPIISDSSEDESPQPRKPFKSSKMQGPRSADGNVFLTNSRKRQIKQRENDGWSSDSSSIQRRRKRVNNLPIITSGESSTSDDEELVRPARRGANKELSDYETGYSSDRTTDTSLIHLEESDDINTLLSNSGGDKISVNYLFKKAGITRRLPTHRLLMPKRMRIVSSDEESDNDPIRPKKNYRSVTYRSEVRKVGRNNVDNRSAEYSDGPSTSASSGSIEHKPDRSQATTSGSTGFGTAIFDSSDERTPTVIPKNTSRNNTEKIPVSTSNINDCPPLCIGDSDDSFPIKTSGRRGARVALRESDEDACPSTLKDMSLDSSSDESEYCPICFMRFDSQEVGTPTNCEHCFCLTCIQEWAKNNNTCPVDRMRFNSIIVRSYSSRNVIREIPVETPIPATVGIEDEWFIGLSILGEDGSFSVFESDSMDDSYDSTNDDGPDEVCSICLERASNDNIILCDFCLNVFHLGCLNPPLRFIPAGDWFCPRCVGIYSAGSSSSESSSE